MTTHTRFNLTRKSQATILILFLLALGWLAYRAPAQTPRAAAQDDCGWTFAGSWQPLQNTNAVINISVGGNSAQGEYTPPGQATRILKGEIQGNYLQGQWYENLPEGPARSGFFKANLVPSEHRLDVNFYENQKLIESAAWTCGPIGGPTSGITPEPPTSPTPTPLPTATPVRDDQDQDNFQTFDSLTPDQQVTVLTKRGPRLPVEYDASDLSLRVLVKEGGPIFLEYGLASDQPAELTITIGERPIYHRLRPARHERVAIPIPFRSGEVLVAKLNIRSHTSAGEPADFELFALAVGERGVQALNKIKSISKKEELAINNAAALNDSDYEPFPLFDPMPQSGITIQIKVDLPTTIRVKQKPENRIDFSCTSGSDFSDGRWEWWRVRGLNWRKVWQKGTGGISRNQTKSEHWNGIITNRKLVSSGSHALQFAAWQKSGSDRDCVVARAPSRLAVIE